MGAWLNIHASLVAAATLIGTIASVVGVWLTFHQARKIQTAAEAARLATEQALGQVRSTFGQFALAAAKRHLGEARHAVDNEEWVVAAIRCGDLAAQAGQLAHADAAQRSVWEDEAKVLYEWQNLWSRAEQGRAVPKSSEIRKWGIHATDLAAKLDRLHSPLGPGAE